MILLVTGVAGFIGSNFIYYMLEKHKDYRVLGLDKLTYAGNLENLSSLSDQCKSRLEFVKGDICDQELVTKLFSSFSFDAVINFAAESHVDRSIQDSQIFIKTNVLGTHVLLESAKQSWLNNGMWANNKKFIQISTDEVYGSLGPTGLFTEKTPLDPHSPYSASKAAADMIVKSYHDTFGMPICITRCSNNYGPYQFPEKFIPLMIRNALLHKEIPVYGDGKQIRDWLFVEDHCRAIDVVLEKALPGSIYNIGGNNEKINLEVVKIILEQLRTVTGDGLIGEDLICHIKDRPGHDRRYGIDATQIRKDLGWKPAVPFKEGIHRTILWYLENKGWMERVTSGEYTGFYEKNYINR